MPVIRGELIETGPVRWRWKACMVSKGCAILDTQQGRDQHGWLLGHLVAARPWHAQKRKNQLLVAQSGSSASSLLH